MGSDSDLDIMQECLKGLKEFGVAYTVKILSAHRSPRELKKFVAGFQKQGIQVVIAAASGAAHLAGVIASETILPVIGIPLPSKHIGGVDSLFATVQMPAGVPVATMAVGSAGVKNAAVCAAEILALHDVRLRKALVLFKKRLEKKVLEKNKTLKGKIENI
jgi:phosphoribosylaminoimidazole carboxylase PurE protein